MAGYSGTPLAKKLGINESFRIFVTGAPRGYPDLLRPIPECVKFVNESGQIDRYGSHFHLQALRTQPRSSILSKEAWSGLSSMGILAEEVREGCHRHHRKRRA